MIASMIDRDPLKRLTAEQYLQEQTGKAFPSCFHTFLLPYVQKILKDFSPDYVIYKYENFCRRDLNFLQIRLVFRLHRDFSYIMSSLFTEASQTNENQTETDEDKHRESSQCLLILLSLALSCMRKLKV